MPARCLLPTTCLLQQLTAWQQSIHQALTCKASYANGQISNPGHIHKAPDFNYEAMQRVVDLPTHKLRLNATACRPRATNNLTPKTHNLLLPSRMGGGEAARIRKHPGRGWRWLNRVAAHHSTGEPASSQPLKGATWHSGCLSIVCLVRCLHFYYMWAFPWVCRILQPLLQALKM